MGGFPGVLTSILEGVSRALLLRVGACAACAAILAAASDAVAVEPTRPESRYWAFRAPEPAVGPHTAAEWARTELDAYVLEGLNGKQLAPSPDASKARLLRRVSLDLTGLPPTPEQTERFLNDDSPDAYVQLVDSLLASPHYGERWAQKWLDVVRFADTNGFESDAYRPHAWRYRDYVVQSFNEDKPFDRFVLEQVAGDELFPGDPVALVATGFHAAGPRHVIGGNQDKEEARQETVTEMALGVGQALLGLTVQCARCHDHKFDPITQKDYYQLEAFFGATDLKDVPLVDEQQAVEYEKRLTKHEEILKPLKSRLKEIEAPFNKVVRERKRGALEPDFENALQIPKQDRDEKQARLAKEAESQIKPVWYEILPLMPRDVKRRRAVLRSQLHEFELRRPDPAPAAFAVENLKEPPGTFILQGGDHRRKGARVVAGVPAILGPQVFDAPEGSDGRRSALARWLVSPGNPLTARVMVNRIWEFRMGRGLMSDPNNFGVLGGMPSHPELLDALAIRFMHGGWSVKAMDRLLVLSSAYRQSSDIDAKKIAEDPDNRLYWRADRRRLSAEAIRDSALAASGRLNRSVSGKPVRIPIEPEVYDLIFTEAEPDNLWPVTPDVFQHDRRTLYLLNKRTVRLPFLANFDQPDAMTSCSIRQTSTHALQSLSLLNSDFMLGQSRSLAERLLAECGDEGSDCLISRAFHLTLARHPSSVEQRLARQFLKSHPDALQDFSLALLNRNEFVYRP